MAWSSAWLKDARKAKGLSQAEVAAKVGASQAQVSQWETGKATPGPDVVAKLSKLLGGAPASAPATATAAPARVTRGQGGPAPRAASGPADVALPASGKLTVDALERYLWSAADILRGSIDSSDYKGFIFGLLFLKRLSDRFDEECDARTAGAW